MRILGKLLLALFLAGTANAQQYASIQLGTVNPVGGVVSLREVSSSTRLIAFGYLAPESKTLTNIRICVADVTGPPATTDAHIDVYASTAGTGVPNLGGGALASATVDASTNGCKTSTAISLAVTAGTQYWFVISNANVVPLSFYFSVRVLPAQGAGLGGSGLSPVDVPMGAFTQESSNGGTTWTALQRNNSALYRLTFSDASFLGAPMISMAQGGVPVDSADRVYSTREVGNKFITPGGADLNMNCISFSAAAIGTPTGSLRYRLYQGTTLIPSNFLLVTKPLSSSTTVTLCDTTVHTLTAATTYRIAMGETAQSDADTDSYGPTRFDWDSDADSLSLKPFNGTISKTVCTGSCDGGSWTDTSTSFYQMQILLKSGDEFAGATPGAGGIMNQYPMYGGMQ